MPDDFNSGVADGFKVLDDVPVPDTWSRVQFKVLDHKQVQTTEEDTTMIDLETLSGSDRQQRPKRVFVAGLLAAAVVALAFVVIRDANGATPADQPSVTVPPTSPPRALPNTWGKLEPGTYYVDEVSGTPTPRIFATIGAGWGDMGEDDQWGMSKIDTGTLTFDRPVAVFSDACHPSDGYNTGPVTTLDGLVAALTGQAGWAEVTEPTDISIDGYAGKAFQRTVPADMSDCDRRDLTARAEVDDPLPGYPDFRSWQVADGDGGGGGGFYYEPGGIETLWVLDLEGTVVVISTGLWSGPTAAAHPDFAADVLDSIRIERT